MDTQQAAQEYLSRPDAIEAIAAGMRGLLHRSATDPDFRAALLSTPREALEEHTGRDYPDSFTVEFIENEVDATFVLPDPIDPAAELSEADLEAVAGGWSPLVVAAVASSWECAASVATIAYSVISIFGD